MLIYNVGHIQNSWNFLFFPLMQGLIPFYDIHPYYSIFKCFQGWRAHYQWVWWLSKSMGIQVCPHGCAPVTLHVFQSLVTEGERNSALLPISKFPQTQQTEFPGSQWGTQAQKGAVWSTALDPWFFAVSRGECRGLQDRPCAFILLLCSINNRLCGTTIFADYQGSFFLLLSIGSH